MTHRYFSSMSTPTHSGKRTLAYQRQHLTVHRAIVRPAGRTTRRTGKRVAAPQLLFNRRPTRVVVTMGGEALSAASRHGPVVVPLWDTVLQGSTEAGCIVLECRTVHLAKRDFSQAANVT